MNPLLASSAPGVYTGIAVSICRYYEFSLLDVIVEYLFKLLKVETMAGDSKFKETKFVEKKKTYAEAVRKQNDNVVELLNECNIMSMNNSH